MYLRSIKTYHFRNLQDSLITFNPGVNVIIGKNGQGKTNLVEAINVLSLSKSFRTSVTSELIKWGETECSLFGSVIYPSIEESESELGFTVVKKSKSFLLNGNPVKSITDFVGRLICVTFSPADLFLLQGPPSGRRKFVDKHMVDLIPGLIGPLISYQRTLQNKNKLLKDGVETASLLDTWNELLARDGAMIANARMDFIKLLEVRAAKIHARFCPSDGKLGLSLKSNVEGDLNTLFNALQKIRSREVAVRSSIVGPHRDDVVVTLGGTDAHAFASQGQTRSIVLSLTLGVIELIEEQRGESPVVLLDDVNSELDTSRSDAFFNLVLTQKRQIFITGTDASVGHLVKESGYSFAAVEGGKVTLLTT